jgi:hypothetical protein
MVPRIEGVVSAVRALGDFLTLCHVDLMVALLAPEVAGLSCCLTCMSCHGSLLVVCESIKLIVSSWVHEAHGASHPKGPVYAPKRPSTVL